VNLADSRWSARETPDPASMHSGSGDSREARHGHADRHPMTVSVPPGRSRIAQPADRRKDRRAPAGCTLRVRPAEFSSTLTRGQDQSPDLLLRCSQAARLGSKFRRARVAGGMTTADYRFRPAGKHRPGVKRNLRSSFREGMRDSVSFRPLHSFPTPFRSGLPKCAQD
jgi:hypothetical protein